MSHIDFLQLPTMSIAIELIIFFSIIISKDNRQIMHDSKILVIYSCLLIIADAVLTMFTAGLVNVNYYLVYYINIVYNIAAFFVAFNWSKFCQNIFEDNNKVYKIISRVTHFLATVLIIVAICLPNSSFFMYKNAEGIATYGTGDYLWYILALVLLAYNFVEAIIKFVNKQYYVSRAKYLAIIFFTVLEAIASVIQIFIPNRPIMGATISIGTMIFYFRIIKNSVSKDELTSLGNRNNLIKNLGKVLSPLSMECDYSLVMMDLDKFKEINDKFGHNVGDKALQDFAKILNECCENYPAKAYRYAGDEFMILFTSVKEEKRNVDELIRLIHKKLSLYNEASLVKYNLDFSSGYSEFKSKTTLSIPEIIDIADKNLYLEKQLKKQNRKEN